MKRLSLSLAGLFVLANLLIVPAMAADNSADYTIYYEDGSYATVTLDSVSTRSSTDEIRTYTYYNPLGQRCFAYTLCASFTYDGVTSKADFATCKLTIYRQGWDMSTHSEYVSGNTAYGRAVFTGPNGESRAASLALTCDKDGNVT